MTKVKFPYLPTTSENSIQGPQIPQVITMSTCFEITTSAPFVCVYYGSHKKLWTSLISHIFTLQALHISYLVPLAELSTHPKLANLGSVEFTVHHLQNSQYPQIQLQMLLSCCSKNLWIFFEDSAFSMAHWSFSLFLYTLGPRAGLRVSSSRLFPIVCL